MAEHILKTRREYWFAVNAGLKRFEVRKNDRAFQSGDTVILRRLAEDNIREEYRNDNTPEFFDLEFRIGWMLQGGQFGIEPGYCVFQLEEVQ